MHHSAIIRNFPSHRHNYLRLVHPSLRSVASPFESISYANTSARLTSTVLSRCSPLKLYFKPFSSIHTTSFQYSFIHHDTVRRQFSTRLIAEDEYDILDDNSKEVIHSGGISSQYIGDDTSRKTNEHIDMPRLQALRERLRVEKEEGGIHQQQRQLFPNNAKNSLDTHTTQTLQEMSSTDYTSKIIANNKSILTDTHGRHHNYLRISLSERCNLRCQYCMPPEGVPLSPSSNLLTDDEIMRLVRLFVKNGVDKVRLTGGEPLLRPNLSSLVRSISNELNMPNNNDNLDMNHHGSGLVGITTNGISLSRHIDDLVDAGLTGVNISLDTLRSGRFMEITRRNGLDKVMRAIEDTTRAFRRKYGDVRVPDGGSRVKINCVVMKGFNDDELSDFVQMADDRFNGDVDIRFIEWMPFNDNGWNTSRFVSYQDMMKQMSRDGMALERIGDGPNDTTKWWRVQNNNRRQDKKADKSSFARIGFITSMSEHFCSSCNRLRITCDGKIKVCLFGSNEKEVSLRDIMRNHQHEDDGLQEEELGKVIHAAVQKKTFALGGHGSAENIAKAADNRPMTLIGG